MTGADLLTHLHRGGGAAYLWAAWPDKRKESLWLPVGKQLPAIPAAWASANIYFGVHPTATMGGKNERSKIATVLAVNCLFAEFDGKDQVTPGEYSPHLPPDFDQLTTTAQQTAIGNAQKAIFLADRETYRNRILAHIETLWNHGNGLFYPSVIVDSGGGYHCYWLLENTVTIDDSNREHIRALQAAWVDLVGGDPASKDLARVLRLPDTMNRKYDPPRPVQIIEADEWRLHSLDILEQFCSLDAVAVAAQQATAATTGKQTDDVISTFNENHRMLDLLTTAGYVKAQERGNVTRLVRPGGASASVVVFADTNQSFHHSGSDPLHSEHTRDAFDVWTHLTHNGDTKAAWTAAKKAQGKWEDAHEKRIEPDPLRLDDVERHTDLGNSFRFVRLHGCDFHFTAGRGWLAWDGTRWAADKSGKVAQAAKSTVLSLYTDANKLVDTLKRLIEKAGSAEASDELRAELDKQVIEKRKLAEALVSWARKSQAKARIDAIIGLAQSDPTIAILDDAFDTDAWLFNCQNGTIDLRTGKLQRHTRQDCITAVSPTAYDPAAACPTWLAFLDRVFAGNAQIIGFMQRLCGYALTGSTRDHVLPFLYGSGANGKSTFITALQVAMGNDYAVSAAPDLLIAKRGERHPTEVADLQGKRLVTSIEVEDGKRLAEGLVKQLTGGDQLKARQMRQDFFTFAPTHKMLLVANHKPTVRGTDYAIWRRIRLIPFVVTIPEAERDAKLPEKLAAEAAGILAWAVRGCLEWQRIGLKAPAEVMAATEEYRTESDTLSLYLEECTVKVIGAETKASALYSAYKTWAEASGLHPINMMKFGLALGERGFEKRNAGRGVIYSGIGLPQREESKGD